MFYIYQSNQIEVFTHLVAYHWKNNPLNNPLTSEIILVPSQGTAEWIEIALAKQLGLSGNIKFYFPNKFIWTMVRCVLPEILDLTILNKEKMIWKILEILPLLLKKEEFKIFKKYLVGEQNKLIFRLLFQVACNIAEMYEDYLIYRPEWIISWQQGKLIKMDHKDQQWQATLWYTLVTNYNKKCPTIVHLANVYNLFVSKLKIIKNSILPERIFIIGMSTLSPLYLQFLHILSKYMDIYLMNTNPCRYYWMDIMDYPYLGVVNSHKRQQKNNFFDEKSKSFCLTVEEPFNYNYLLSSWGKLGSDYLYWLSQIETYEIDAFVDIEGVNLLSCIQHDILELEDHTILGMTPETFNNSYKKRLLKLEDNSISIHRCKNKHHEVEILYQNLVKIMNKDPTITPDDIIVMVANIDDYYPFIQSVFGSLSSEKNYLPFYIADVSIVKIYPLLHTFLTLLQLPETQSFTSDYIFSLLDVPEIILHFHMNKNDLSTIRTNEHLYSYIWKNITNNNCNLYDYLTKSLPGNDQQKENFKINYNLQLASKIFKLVKNLCKWRLFLSHKRIIKNWMTVCKDLMDNFFLITDKETESAFLFVEHQWRKMLLQAKFYPNTIHSIFLCKKFISIIHNIKLNQKFFTGGINFSSLIPMRSLPFKIVCLLGMNEGVYPRRNSTFCFNLMNSFSERGDPNIHDNDKYLFLESLLSARNIFYISYVDYFFQDKNIRLSSILVRKLIDYISKNFVLPFNDSFNLDRSTQLVREHLVCVHTNNYCYSNNFYHQIKLPNQQNIVNNNSEINQVNCQNNFSESQLQHIDIQQFLLFWQHPIRYFFQTSLGVNFFSKEKWISNSNYLYLANEYRRKKYEMNTQLLTSLIKNKNLKIFQDQDRVSKTITERNVFEEIYWNEQYLILNKLSQKIKKYYCQGIKRQQINLKISGIRLLGEISHIKHDGIIRWRAGKLNFQDGLKLWLEHLIYCCVINKAGISRMFGKNNTKWCFPGLTPPEARKWLIYFIKGYQQGLKKPLLLLPQSSSAWIQASFNMKTANIGYDKITQFQSRQKILRSWLNYSHMGGERNDPYLQRLFGCSLNELIIQEIIKNAETWLLPLMIFNKHNY
ncbi:MAG: exodeoxyribonuclease V subunit gamma [Candidatus Dasytiphilus stammeri]